MGNILGFVGQIAGSAIQAQSAKTVTQMQLDAIKKQQKLVYESLDPSVIGGQATTADVQRAQQQLALQGLIDPALLQTRYAAEGGIKNQLDQILASNSPADQVAAAAAKNALTPSPGMTDVKNKLVDAALEDLKGGATLPPDLEAQIVQHGLERSGQVTGKASAQGVGGTMLRTLFGSEGIKLQAQRQAQAANLATSAQQLDTARAQVLGALFPNLTAQQTAKLAATGSTFGATQAAVPQAGLSGTDIANIWMARVGATNQLTQSAANSAAQGALAQASIWGNAIGGATRAAPGAYSDLKNIFSSSNTPGSTTAAPNNASLDPSINYGTDVPAEDFSQDMG
jgi:hypothetical protein